MIEFSLVSIGLAFVAGLLTFFAPCTFPLIPAFLGVIAGVGQDELQDPEKLKRIRWKIFSNAIFYVLGFSLVFVLFGVAFSLLGKIAVIQIWIQRIGGILIIIFGLYILGLIKLGFLNAEKKFSSERFTKTASKANSFGIGALFALGWSPCVGPILGGIYLLASTSGSIIGGTFLLVVFSAGLGIPFLLTALLVGRAMSSFSKWGRALKIINSIAGVFLIILGVLLVTDQFGAFLSLIQSSFGRFDFFQELLLKFEGNVN